MLAINNSLVEVTTEVIITFQVMFQTKIPSFAAFTLLETETLWLWTVGQIEQET